MNRAFPGFVSLILFAGTAWAHSSLERSKPRDGEILKVAPREVRLWFTEPIKVGLSTFEVRNAAGKQVDQHDLRADEKQPALVRLSLPSTLAPDVYKVSWSAVAQDLHVTKGSVSFKVAP